MMFVVLFLVTALFIAAALIGNPVFFWICFVAFIASIVGVMVQVNNATRDPEY